MPASVVLVVGVHSSWSGPAFAVCALPLNTLMVTSSNVLPFGHGPLFTVQRNTLLPMPKLFTCVVELVGLTMLPLPLIKVHCPVAGLSKLLPASVVLVTGVQSCWSGPASAAGFALLYTVMETWSVLVPQAPLFSDHTKMFTPTERLLTLEVALVSLPKMAVPCSTLQDPVAGEMAAFAAKMAEEFVLHNC